MPEISIYDFEDDDFNEEGDLIGQESTLDESKLFDFLRENSWPKQLSSFGKDCITVYLAGPIEAELHQEAPHSIAWREKIKSLFEMDEETVWDVRNPNNGKTDGVNYIKVESNEHYYNPYILFRTDLANLADSDFVVVNLSKSAKSFGTSFEMGYAYCLHKPIICICEPGKVPIHPFITQSVEAFVYSEEEAVNLIKFILNEES
jgi:nucleoside 2-deoxyribosyltransferase